MRLLGLFSLCKDIAIGAVQKSPVDRDAGSASPFSPSLLHPALPCPALLCSGSLPTGFAAWGVLLHDIIARVDLPPC